MSLSTLKDMFGLQVCTALLHYFHSAKLLSAFPNMFSLFKHFEYPHLPSPVSVLRVSINTSPDALMGVKYKVETVRVLPKKSLESSLSFTQMFEDDGKAASGATSAVYDVQRNLLFINGTRSGTLAEQTLTVI